MDKLLPLSISISGNDKGFDELGRKLLDYNAPLFGAMNITPLLLSFRDGNGALQAGLSGKIFYEWLTIDLLWVDENLRGKGYGRALMQRAEEEAVARGCRYAWVDTIGPQALGFYAKNGYAVWGALPDYPQGHTRTFLRKMLTT